MELHAADRNLLKKALETLNITVDHEANGIIYGRYKGTRIEIRKDSIIVQRGYESVVNQIKQEYTRKVAERDARKNGWRIQYTNQEKTKGFFIKQ